MTRVNLKDYTYDLPDERIASYPLRQRDQSKLLVYNGGKISHHRFFNITELLPENALLFFNNTKVIPARIHFLKPTGATIEIFLLNPVSPTSEIASAMRARSTSTWHCTIGNLKRWPANTPIEKRTDRFILHAELVDRENGVVKFQWNDECTFAEVITRVGVTPLPPYIRRAADDTDRDRYQTVYSHYEGAVAAPTAGLHFTDEILAGLKAKGIALDYLTLHVSAGTFQPVKVDQAEHHIMHEEQVVVTRQNIERLLTDKLIIAVGTTSMRTLESIYWFGAKLLTGHDAGFTVDQNEPYRPNRNIPDAQEAIRAVYDHMNRNNLQRLTGRTSIYILPGYKFKICKGLITNFHQPQSTLILLVAAFIGNDWRSIYHAALSSQYRFLSYGDSSLIIP